MTFKLISSYPTKAKAILIPLLQTDDLAKQLKAICTHFMLDTKRIKADFSAKKGEILFLYPFTKDGTKKIVLVGCGKKISYKTVQQQFKQFSFQHKELFINANYVDATYFNEPTLIEAAINGLGQGTYAIGLYKEKVTDRHPLLENKANLTLISTNKKVKKAAQKGWAIAQTQCSIMDLVNAPSNYTTPIRLAEWAIASGKANGFKVDVLDKAQIEELGLHTLLAVNRGSERPPRFIIMEYQPKTKSNLPSIGLVGKGVTFDTGGISMKGPNNMHYMKSDMGGAAAVLGTMEAVAKLQLPIHLVGIVPATDNAVDAYSINPGDVINSYSGKTIEVTDTDAEGRLILADGIAYMNKHYKVDTLIDLATLTGSCVRTFGYHAGGLFSNNEELAGALRNAGDAVGERVWQLPIWEEYADDMQSDIADIKNFSGKPMAGAITAAKFIEFFTNDHPRWAHLDIAGVAFGNSILSKDKSAKGFGVRLLVEFIENLL